MSQLNKFIILMPLFATGNAHLYLYSFFCLATEDRRPVNVKPVATTGGFVSLAR